MMEQQHFTRASLEAFSEAHERDLNILLSSAPDYVKAQVEKRLQENDDLITEASIAWLEIHGFKLSEWHDNDRVFEQSEAMCEASSLTCVTPTFTPFDARVRTYLETNRKTYPQIIAV
jgi:hypothetical protein